MGRCLRQQIGHAGHEPHLISIAFTHLLLKEARPPLPSVPRPAPRKPSRVACVPSSPSRTMTASPQIDSRLRTMPSPGMAFPRALTDCMGSGRVASARDLPMQRRAESYFAVSPELCFASDPQTLPTPRWDGNRPARPLSLNCRFIGQPLQSKHRGTTIDSCFSRSNSTQKCLFDLALDAFEQRSRDFRIVREDDDLIEIDVCNCLQQTTTVLTVGIT